MTPYTPSPDEIAEACEAIRAAWSAAEHEARLEKAIDMQVELVAAILRPLAVADGLILADEVTAD